MLNQSNVARMRAQIEQEYEAALLALYGYRTAASHEIIERAFASYASAVVQMTAVVAETEGEEAAKHVFLQSMEAVDEIDKKWEKC